MVKLDIQNCDNLKKLKASRRSRNKSKLVPQHPFRWIVNGPSGSSKTNTVTDFLLRLASFDRLYICTKHMHQNKMVLLKEFFDKIKEKCDEDVLFMTDKLEEMPDLSELDPDLQNIIIFDDLMLEKDQRYMIDAFVRCRHSNSSVIYISHRFNAIPRTIRLNANYFSFFAVPNKKELNLLYNEVGMELTKEEFIRKFKNAVKKKYNFFHIDIHNPHKELRFRRNFNEIELGK